MSSQALKELVNAIFGNPGTHAKFLSDPKEFIARSSLTQQEKKAALNTFGSMGLVSSGSPQLEATLKANIDWMAGGP